MLGNRDTIALGESVMLKKSAQSVKKEFYLIFVWVFFDEIFADPVAFHALDDDGVVADGEFFLFLGYLANGVQDISGEGVVVRGVGDVHPGGFVYIFDI